ncbi:hypothetical protein [Pseudoteredinibacter isoporae]|uniref:Uncharacterized protein n=1 Tax=Pseudoteredinibacter isoporae TaxID=570281 RepID=A0A7X0JWJ6_9GAMM|nr:hypothetical protein [Pseudoteredinibacter isoporae]MBB6522606.1 hypothetical protein [Pseudoteredinibacter isoporae]NHO88136.1 hypothetical protein [Pseudoteredinibacter isoporae]NIB23533.1 hypothetical protein [Pseudoteredinibacter isoporae]
MKESFEFVRKLNQQAVLERGGNEIAPKERSTAVSLFCRDHQLARIMAMSELLNWSPAELTEHLLDCMLADAHNGFLASYDNSDVQEKDDELLKSRVRYWRETLNNNKRQS